MALKPKSDYIFAAMCLLTALAFNLHLNQQKVDGQPFTQGEAK